MVAVRNSESLGIVAPDGEPVIDPDLMQGLWTEEQYLKITDSAARFLEFTDGNIEVLPMPTRQHQLIIRFMLAAFESWVLPLGGIVLFAVFRLHLRQGKVREPDILLLLNTNDPRNQEDFWQGADLVLEVVSSDNPQRDTKVKRVEYAEAGIPEYWIVNPLDETITVLALAGNRYAEHGVFRRGEQATSVLLVGFSVDVSMVLDAKLQLS